MNRETYDDPSVRKYLLEHFIPLLHFYTGEAKYREIAEAGMGYLTSPPILDAYGFLPDVLQAEAEMLQEPVHLTVVGAKDDPRAAALVRAGLAYPLQLGPDRFRSELARLRAGHRLHVGGEPFLDPVMPRRDRGKGQVDELVDQGPVAGEIGGGGLCPDDDADRDSTIPPRPPAAHAGA
jgi:hypothetical protein